MSLYMKSGSRFVGGYDAIEKAMMLVPPRNDLCALDIGAGSGGVSKKLADRGFVVDAIDPQYRDRFKRDPINNHPNITFTCGTIQDYQITRQYDFVALLNVIMFLDRGYVMHDLLPLLQNHLTSGGVLCIAYLIGGDGLEQKMTNQNRFAQKELVDVLRDLKYIDAFDTVPVQQHHHKHGSVSFHSRCLIFQKN